MINAKVGQAPPVSAERTRELVSFQRKLGVQVEDVNMFNLAFTHRSYTNECPDATDNNERLEFLGDSVLSLSVSDWLFLNLPAKHEGDFSRIRSAVVSEDSLYEVAVQLGVGELLLVGKGERITGGKKKKAILSDCMEAIFGCVYLDQGFFVAKELIERLMVGQIQAYFSHKLVRDYKTAVQEYSQKEWKCVPEYELVKTEGPDHKRVFFMNIKLNGTVFGPASGQNKKQAQQNAAKLAFEALTAEGHQLDC
ncbi:MAG: ribonuclease III [Spirochaetia bacterium]|jgi:ribonuclease-3|nr:ribonuclease III [Spirochaetia bacterium]